MREKIYIGGYADTISICTLDKGKLEIINRIKNIEKPSYLNINRDVLYAVSENKNGSISSFKITDDKLELINTEITNESLPCYITTDKNRERLLVANYESGSIDLFAIKQNGAIGKRIKTARYENGKIHFCEFVGQAIYAVDLGNDRIYIYNSNLELQNELIFPCKSAPRHLSISKQGNRIFVVTEMSNEIFMYEKKKSQFVVVQRISTVLDDKVQSFGGAIKISNNGRNLYVTNRGEDTICVYSISNQIQLIQRISCGGKFPRDISLNKDEQYLMVANQKSDNIEVYKREIETGILYKIENLNMKIEKPSCIVKES